MIRVCQQRVGLGQSWVAFNRPLRGTLPVLPLAIRSMHERQRHLPFVQRGIERDRFGGRSQTLLEHVRRVTESDVWMVNLQ